VPNLYEHELSSYKREIEEQHKARASLSIARQDPSFNLTHFALGLSNRANLMVIGLCSLVEVRLYEIAEQREKETSFKLKDSKGSGLTRLQVFLTRTDSIDFGKLKSWGDFRNHLYTIRNALVHGYGGVVPFSNLDKVKKSVEALGIQQVLCSSRIRFETDALWKAHKVVSQLIDEINKQTT